MPTGALWPPSQGCEERIQSTSLTVCVCVFVQVLGDRWAAICKWTEERWLLLQDILLKWQHFTEEQVGGSDMCLPVPPLPSFPLNPFLPPFIPAFIPSSWLSPLYSILHIFPLITSFLQQAGLQVYRSLLIALPPQVLFDSWLTTKEELVRSIKTSDCKEQADTAACLRRLAVSDRGSSHCPLSGGDLGGGAYT